MIALAALATDVNWAEIVILIVVVILLLLNIPFWRRP